MILIVLLYALCASTFTICKAILCYSKPIFFVGVRMLFAGVLLLGYHYWAHRKFAIQKSDRMLFGSIILFHIYFAYILDVWSLQYLTSVQSSFLYNLSPFLSALFSYICFAETMTIRKWIGLSLGFSACLPELLVGAFKSHTASEMIFMSLPQLVLLLAIFSAVYGWTIMRKLIKDQGYSPILVNGIGMFGGGLLALATSFFMEDLMVTSPVTHWVQFIKLTLLIIVVANILFYNFYGYLLARYTSTFLSFAGFTCPLFTALYGWIFLGETVSMSFFASLSVIFVGLYLFYQEELRQGYIVEYSASPEEKIS